MMACQAVAARVARHMMGCDDPIPHLEILHPFTSLHNFTGYLMAQYEWSSFCPVPFHYIAATDTAGLHSHDHFAWTAYRSRHFLYTNVAVVVIHGHAHEFHPQKKVQVLC
jgi:hypothetical protein